MSKDIETPFCKAIRLSGLSKAAFARELDLSRQYVGDISRGRRSVPPNKCKLIESLVAGEVTACELRPDIFAPELAA